MKFASNKKQCWQRRRRRRRSKYFLPANLCSRHYPTQVSIVVVIQMIVVVLLCHATIISCVMSTNVIGINTSRPSVVLNKLGLVSGLRFDDSDDNSTSALAVAAFLGVPYAAPPVGPLRFMPPGAIRFNLAAPTLSTCQQLSDTMNANQKSSKVQARPFTQFGHECVQLFDWLEPSSLLTAQQSSSFQLDRRRQQQQQQRRRRQSEDCLNLNIFVPYQPTRTSAIVQQQFNHSPTGHKLSNQINRNLIEQQQEQEQRQQASACYLDQLTNLPNASQKLPVVVLFHTNNAHMKKRNNSQDNNNNNTSDDELADSVANSLVHVHASRRLRAIVITFNYRLGLLGHLPYSDLDTSNTNNGHTMRQNHALWDQIGLLHWLKHNVASFNGDPNNITLASADESAAHSIVLLSMSPVAKGLFKRILVTTIKSSDQNDDDLDDDSTNLNRMFRLANKLRDMKRILFNELGVLVNKQQRQTSGELAANKTVDLNQDTDKRLFEYLKSASLTQLATLEQEISSIRTPPPPTTTFTQSNGERLADLFNYPHLDDKLLFPQLAYLVNSNKLIIDGQKTNVWTQLMHALDNKNGRAHVDDIANGAFQHSNNYCLYLRHLYDNVQQLNKSANEQVSSSRELLNQFDPLKLMARLSDHQLKPTNQVKVSTVGGDTTSSSGEFLVNNKWRPTHLNELSNNNSEEATATTNELFEQKVLAFNHLQHVFELHSMLNRRLALKLNLTTGRREVESQQVEYDDDDYNNNSSLDMDAVPHVNTISLARVETNNAEEDDDDDDEENNSSAKQLQQRHSFHGLMRTGRRARLASVVASNEQRRLMAHELVDLLNSYDLMIGFVGEPLQTLDSSLSHITHLSRALFRLLGNKQLDARLLFWLQLAGDVRSVSSPIVCDTKSVRHDSRGANSFVFISDKGSDSLHENLKSTFSSVIINLSANLLEGVASFVRNGKPTWPAFDTLHKHVELLPAAVDADVRELISLQTNLAQYLMQVTNMSSDQLARMPADLAACLGELETVAGQQQQQVGLSSPETNSWISRLHKESRCLTSLLGKLRHNVRSLAARELEPLVVQFYSLLLPNKTSSTGGGASLALLSKTTMTTRSNLANQSDGMYLDQQLQSDASTASGGGEATIRLNGRRISISSRSNDATIDGINEERIALIDDEQQQLTTKAHVVNPPPPPPNTGVGFVVRNFFAKSYKNAVGQALTIVIGTGLAIVLLNLLIVLIITWRSRKHQTRHRVQQQHQQQQSGFGGECELLAAEQLKTTSSMVVKPSTTTTTGGGGQLKRCQVQATSERQPRSNKSIKFDLSSVEGEHKCEMLSTLTNDCATTNNLGGFTEMQHLLNTTQQQQQQEARKCQYHSSSLSHESQTSKYSQQAPVYTIHNNQQQQALHINSAHSAQFYSPSSSTTLSASVTPILCNGAGSEQASNQLKLIVDQQQQQQQHLGYTSHDNNLFLSDDNQHLSPSTGDALQQKTVAVNLICAPNHPRAPNQFELVRSTGANISTTNANTTATGGLFLLQPEQVGVGQLYYLSDADQELLFE